MNQNYAVCLLSGCSLFSVLASVPVQAQIDPDNTLPDNTKVTQQEDVFQIEGGTTRGTNLFHSFQEFNVGNGQEASFNNPDTISNILSRVTGGNISNIDGLISANGTANLFLINPAGIIFGSNSSLRIGGSFLGSTADSILFPDGVEFSATNTPAQPVLTINAPIGLGFRDNPGTIINRSFNEENFSGLEVAANETLALIGGDISLEQFGFMSTNGGRIELGSVAENNTVSLTEVEKGWDIGYEGVENFQDINLSGRAIIYSFAENAGDIQVQGKNISIIEGSEIILDNQGGQAANLEIVATDSLKLEQTVSDEIPTLIANFVLGDAIGEGSKLEIETNRLEIKGGQIGSLAQGSGRGTDLEIKASEIALETNEVPALIFAQVFDEGDGGNLTLETETLTLDNGAQINASTFGTGNAGNLSVNASESIELIGTFLDSEDPNAPTGIIANVEEFATATGNGGDITINTPRLVVRDGAQIATAARNQGQGGNILINADESILLSGTSPKAEFRGEGRSGIFVSTEPSFPDEEGNPIVTTGNGGTLNLTTGELIIEQGAQISADTRSLGNGGNASIDVNKLILREGGEINTGSFIGVNIIDAEDPQRGTGGTININAAESVEITGSGEINGEAVNSSIFTLAESDGDAGDLTLTTDQLTVSDGGEINTSAAALGAAGNLTIRANNLDLNQGTLKAETAAGTGGNITLDIDDTITLSSESLISAAATGDANGGNIDIDTSFIVASPQGNSDILANAQQGTGGRITIDAESIFGLQVRPQSNSTNDIDASGGVDGQVIINTPDVDVTKGLVEAPQNVVELEQSVAQACRRDIASGTASGLVVKGKGGIPPKPTEPFIADPILVNGQIDSNNPQVYSPEIKPIQTSIGDIYPARGIIKTETGQIILTNYPTDIDSRTPYLSASCSRSN